nr:unnamed protein product [Callosobruchus analis]
MRYGHTTESRPQVPPLPRQHYQDTYTHLESPEKVSTLERQKHTGPLHSHIDNLDSATYGLGANSYGQNSLPSGYTTFAQQAPKFSSQADYSDSYASTCPSHYSAYDKVDTPTMQYQPSSQYIPTSQYQTTPSSQYQYQKSAQYTPGTQYQPSPHFVPISQPSDYFAKSDSKQYSDGYSSSEYVSSTQKTPEGYKTNTYKYESYKSTPQPTYSSSSEKYYTSMPGASSPLEKKTFETFGSPFDKKSFDTFKNGGDSQFQSSFSTNVEYVNEPPILREDDTLEQRMLKKSVTQQIIEKKTVSMTKSSKQESSTRSFKFE